MNVAITDLKFRITPCLSFCHSSSPNGWAAKSPSSPHPAVRSANWTNEMHPSTLPSTAVSRSSFGTVKIYAPRLHLLRPHCCHSQHSHRPLGRAEPRHREEIRPTAQRTHAGWSPLLWVLSVISCWTPMHYALFPPNMPPREDLLVRDDKTGVAHPTLDAKKVKSIWAHWVFEVLNSMITLYTTGVLAASFLF
jgi:hypothetical protein